MAKICSSLTPVKIDKWQGEICLANFLFYNIFWATNTMRFVSRLKIVKKTDTHPTNGPLGPPFSTRLSFLYTFNALEGNTPITIFQLKAA